MDVTVEELATPAVADRAVEIVERKGVGHPDSICDALSEGLSVALSKFYLERFGQIMHHNVDKGLLWGGRAEPAFGGGRILAPIEVYLAGRATAEVKGVTVPVAELAEAKCRAWFRKTFHALERDAQVKLHCLVRPGSAELVDLFERASASGVWLANDTSCGAGYAPLTELERIVLAAERLINSAEFKAAHPETGEDVKVMGVRHGGEVSLTIACAFIGPYTESLDAYLARKAEVAEAVQERAQAMTTLPVRVEVNTADQPANGAVYLTVTGTSAEAGDDGQTGRGNRANGLIAPCRPMTMEAVAGKNPVTHVGKLYNSGATLIAAAIVDRIPEVVEAECYLVSQIGRPVHEPRICAVRARSAAGPLDGKLIGRVSEVARGELAGIGELWKRFVAGELSVV